MPNYRHSSPRGACYVVVGESAEAAAETIRWRKWFSDACNGFVLAAIHMPVPKAASANKCVGTPTKLPLTTKA